MNMSTVAILIFAERSITPHLSLIGYVCDVSLQDLIHINQSTTRPPKNLGWGVNLLDHMFKRNNEPLKTVIAEVKASINEPSDLAKMIKEETDRLAHDEFIVDELPVYLHIVRELPAPVRIR